MAVDRRPPATGGADRPAPLRPGHAPHARPAFPDVRVRPMRPRHLGRVLTIERRVYPRPWTPGVFESELGRTGPTRRNPDAPDDRRYLVALGRSGGARWFPRRVVGYAGILVQAAEAHVTTVAVDPEHHRRKVATHLLLGLMEAACAMGAEAATLEARVANRGAQRLYTGFGFAPVGVRPRYYAETGEDAIVMWAHDLQGPAYAELLEGQRARLASPGGASGAADLHVPWVHGRVGLPPRRREGD